MSAARVLTDVPTHAPPIRTVAHLRLFGALRAIRTDGSEAFASDFRTAKTRQLLRLLALQDGDPVRVDTLIDLLWHTVPVGRGRASLRTAACQLRSTLRANHVVRVGDTLQLRDVEVDVTRFQHEAVRARRALTAGDLRRGLARAHLALRLYAGPLAEDEPWLDPILQAQAQLAMQRRELQLAAGGAALELDRPHDAIGLVASVLDDDGTCERACRLLMLAYGQLAERSMALRVYERFRRTLAEELGVSPSADTAAMYLDLLNDVAQPWRTA
jgi:SARP family transcriptional regulator, regulator of embCAB operon